LEKLIANIQRLKGQADKVALLRKKIEAIYMRELHLQEEINALTKQKEELSGTVLSLQEQIQAMRAAGIQNGTQSNRSDAELKQYISGLIREIDKSLKNWED
jgi:predicted  nucleic acid-binding Zn-ribbon protein